MSETETAKRERRDFWDIRDAFLFNVPLLGIIFIFILVPVCGTFVNSMFNDISFLEKEFVFFKNFSHLLGDRGFLQSLRFTLLFIIVTVPVEIVLGIIFAVLMNTRLPFRGLLRACVLVPWAIPAAVSARTWELVYNYSYGLANFVFEGLGFVDEPINWLGSSFGAFTAVAAADIWKTTPFVAMIILAGLQAVPDELYRQSKVDRANFFQTFYKITLPLIRPVIIVSFLFRTIDGLRVFDLIYVLTGGGPAGSTSSLSHFAYKYYLSGDFGYGSAVSVVLFVIAFVLSLFYIKFGKFSTESI